MRRKRPAAAKKEDEAEKKEELSEKMDPADDSFHVSPIKSEKYGENEGKQVSKQQATSGNKTLSGISEFDHLGGSDSMEQGPTKADNPIKVVDEASDDFAPTRKSLEKDFKEAAEQDKES